ncbi:unnamed protein product [Musa hybrid cultivar]
MERATVAAGTKAKLGSWTRRASLNLSGYSQRDGDEDFRWLTKEDGDDSGTPSPPLWKNVGLPATRSADNSPAHKHHHGMQAFPTSRAEEIARYRQEMLDLVRDMPEPAYELSLRDMVEAPRVAKTVQEMIEKRRTESKDRSKEKRRLLRTESIETGVFLKMFVPISIRGGRRKSFGGSNTCSKVSPRPVSAEAEKGGLEVTEGEWWEKELGGRRSSSSSMIVGEAANFAAYAFAPAILVTPLGALSIIISAALAHIILRERLNILGIVGCVLCVVGSTTIVLHAPQEREIESVKEVWNLATEPAFLCYATIVGAVILVLIFCYIPRYGQTNIMFYVGVCSLVGSLSVMSVKALGIALKLTFSGMNQLIYPQTWAFTIVVLICVVTQMNYLNKALDTFKTAVVSPIYYVMFTSLTILASTIMFKEWDGQNPTQIVTEMCGFVTILSGTFLLHKTKDMADGGLATSPSRFHKHADENGYTYEGIPLKCHEPSRAP